jgi:hypothetical protein
MERWRQERTQVDFGVRLAWGKDEEDEGEGSPFYMTEEVLEDLDGKRKKIYLKRPERRSVEEIVEKGTSFDQEDSVLVGTRIF